MSFWKSLQALTSSNIARCVGAGVQGCQARIAESMRPAIFLESAVLVVGAIDDGAGAANRDVSKVVGWKSQCGGQQSP